MPLYQRTCKKCEFSCENIEKISEGDISKDCPECETADSFIKDISSGTSFKLKGEGWASDGYDYSYTTCKAGMNEKKNKGKVLRHHNLNKKLKKSGFGSIPDQ